MAMLCIRPGVIYAPSDGDEAKNRRKPRDEHLFLRQGRLISRPCEAVNERF